MFLSALIRFVNFSPSYQLDKHIFYKMIGKRFILFCLFKTRIYNEWNVESCLQPDDHKTNSFHNCLKVIRRQVGVGSEEFFNYLTSREIEVG